MRGLCSSALVALLTVFGLARTDDWARHARRLSGISDEARRSALAELKKIPDLDRRLVVALDGAEKAAALDAMVALGRTGLVPALLSSLPRDADGTVAVALGALLTDDNAGTVASAFAGRLGSATSTPVPALQAVAMLDTLARLEVDLPIETCLALLKSPSPEVRLAVVSFARLRLRDTPGSPYAAVLSAAIGTPPWQLRVRALLAVKELAGAPGLPPPGTFAERCRRDPHPEVRRVCDGIGGSSPHAGVPPPSSSSSLSSSSGPVVETPDLARVPLGPWVRTPGCVERYRTLYGDLTDLEIRILFGYKDARPARFVGDGYERALLAGALVSPCRGGSVACGFVRDDDDADRFEKIVPGPDGRPRRVRLLVMAPAAGPDDDENRKDPFQAWQSRRTEEAFVQGLGRSAVVLYDGHSRDGGGPDFGPPRLTADGHPDYRWYARSRPGVAILRSGLGRPKDRTVPRARFVGLYSCASERHFVTVLRRDYPGVALATASRTLYWADALRGLLRTLSALLGQWCPPDLGTLLSLSGLSLSREAGSSGPRAGGTIHVSGLFDEKEQRRD